MPGSAVRIVWEPPPPAEKLRLLPPGVASAEPPGAWAPPPDLDRVWGVDRKGGVFWSSRRGELHRVDVARHVDTVVAGIPPRDVFNLKAAAVAADGTLYYSAVQALVRRQVVSNFGERPRPAAR